MRTEQFCRAVPTASPLSQGLRQAGGSPPVRRAFPRASSGWRAKAAEGAAGNGPAALTSRKSRGVPSPRRDAPVLFLYGRQDGCIFLSTGRKRFQPGFPAAPRGFPAAVRNGRRRPPKSACPPRGCGRQKRPQRKRRKRLRRGRIMPQVRKKAERGPG